MEGGGREGAFDDGCRDGVDMPFDGVKSPFLSEFEPWELCFV